MAEGSSGLSQAAVDELNGPLEDLLPQSPTDADELEAEQRKSIFEKIRFTWRATDQAILVRIQGAVDEEFANNFRDAIDVFQRFYGAMHIPDTNPVTGMALVDRLGRQVYKRDEDGRFVEDYSQLTGQDFEEAILGLQRLRLDVAPRISQLLQDAVYGKMTAGDLHDDVYWATVDGTINDRTARANRDTRTDRYHAFFRYCLWQTAKDFYDEIGRFMSYLEKIRTWKSFER